MAEAKANNNDVQVHAICRKRYTDKRNLTKLKDDTPSCAQAETRNTNDGFDSKKNCLFCNTPCVLDKKNPSRKNWHCISTLQIKESILEVCNKGLDIDKADEWAMLVKTRSQGCIDLVAAQARYHTSCRPRFQSLVSNHDTDQTEKRGRKASVTHMDCFEKACTWLENESDIHSVKDFKQKVQELLGDEIAYNVRYLKQLLKIHYGSHIDFCEENGKDTVIFFVDKTSYLVKAKYSEKTLDNEDEALQTIRRAAKLIKGDLKSQIHESEFYPSTEDITSSWIPDSLIIFLSEFTGSTLKQESIGQSIANLASTNNMPPLFFALSIEVDHLYGSRWLNDKL